MTKYKLFQLRKCKECAKIEAIIDFDKLDIEIYEVIPFFNRKTKQYDKFIIKDSDPKRILDVPNVPCLIDYEKNYVIVGTGIIDYLVGKEGKRIIKEKIISLL